MTKTSILLCAAAGFVFTVAGCDRSTAPSPLEITQADADQLAADMDEIAELAGGDFGASFSEGASAGASQASSEPIAIDREFTITRSCPRGGKVTIAGRTTGTADRATQTIATETNSTRTDVDCAFGTRNGIVTLNGNPNIAHNAILKFVAGKPLGPQTQSQKGSFRWTRSSGRSGVCDVDVTSVFDPETHTVTVNGTICGRTVSVTRTRQR